MAEKLPPHLNVFYWLTENIIFTLSSTVKKDASLIKDLRSRQSSDNEYVTYVSVLWEHQPSWVGVFFGQLLVIFVSVFGGFFFVLLRMVGAFGGRKVQNITHWYTFALRFYSVSMIILTAVNGIFIACLWGSSGHLAIANTKSAAILEPGVPMVRDYVTGAIAELSTILTNHTTQRRILEKDVRNAHKDYLANATIHAQTILLSCGFPTDAQKAVLEKVIQNMQQGMPRSNLKAAVDRLFNITTPLSVRFTGMLETALRNYIKPGDLKAQLHLQNLTSLARGIVASEFENVARMYVAMAQTVHDLSVVVNETVYPNVTFMSVLGQLSIYGDIFKQGYGYTTTVCASATVLQVLMALSFVLGVFYHDEEVPPNKRGLITNQSGIMMTVTCLFMWVFYAAMMLAATLFMTGGVLGYNYLCLPFYDNRLTFVDQIFYNDSILLAYFKIIGALFVPGGVKKDADPKIYEFYDTTLKPSLVLGNSCDNNMSLIKLSNMRDIKDFEKQFLVASAIGDLQQAKAFAHWNHDAVTSGTISATWPERDSILTASMNQHLLSYMLKIVDNQLATMNSVKDYVYESLGNCKPLFTFYKKAFNAFCESNIVHLNGFWLALWLVCFLFSCIVTVALKLSKYLMRMDDYLYAGIEVEESVASDSADRTEGFSLSFAPSLSPDATDAAN